MKEHDTFFTKIYTSHFIARKGLKLTANIRERETGRRRQTQDSEDYYIDLFLTCVMIPYSEPHVFASLRRGTQLEADCGPIPPLPASSVADRQLCDCKTDDIWRGYPCIYNFIKLTSSSSCQPTWAACLHGCILCREVPDWRLHLRSICNINRWRLS